MKQGNRRPMEGEIKSGIPPTGIIRTLPYGPNHSEQQMRAAYQKMVRGLKRLNSSDSAYVLIGMSATPRVDVLHCYVIVEGKVIGRAHIAGYQDGDEQGAVQCWDNSTRRHRVWAILSGPFEPAPTEILRRGFQGFRYTNDLW
jgi:hypothetical protein